MERNVSSSEAIDPSSDLVSNSEPLSESWCDGFLAAETVPKAVTLLLSGFRNVGRCQLLM